MKIERYQIQKAASRETKGEYYTLDFDLIWRLFGLKTKLATKEAFLERYFRIKRLKKLIHEPEFHDSEYPYVGHIRADGRDKYYTSIKSLELVFDRIGEEYKCVKNGREVFLQAVKNSRPFLIRKKLERLSDECLNGSNVDSEIEAQSDNYKYDKNFVNCVRAVNKPSLLKKWRNETIKQYEEAKDRADSLEQELLQYNAQLVQEFKFSLEDLFNASGIASPSYLINVLYNNFEEDRDYIKEKLGRKVHIFITPQCYNCLILALRSYKGVDVSRLPNPECIVIGVNEYFRKDDEEHGKNKRFPKAR